jgi:hypothetical protein
MASGRATGFNQVAKILQARGKLSAKIQILCILININKSHLYPV